VSHIGDNEGMRPFHKSLVREEGEEYKEKEGEVREGGVLKRRRRRRRGRREMEE
jgi:hypothetical protein